MKKLDEARESYNQARDERERLTQVAPEESEFQRKLANSHMNLGNLEKDCGNFDTARDHYVIAQGIRENVPAAGIDDPKLLRDLGMGHYNLAILSITEGNDDAARKTLDEDAIPLFKRLHEADPAVLEHRARLATAYRILAALEYDVNVDKGMDLFREALGHLEALARKNPVMQSFQADLASLYLQLGWMEGEQRRPQAGLKYLRQASGTLQTLFQLYPDVPKYRRDLAATLRTIGQVHMDAGDYREARENLHQARDHFHALCEQFPENGEFQEELENTLSVLEDLEKLDVVLPKET